MSVSGPSQSQSIGYTQLAQDEIYLEGQGERTEETADLYIDTGTPILPEDISTFYSLNFPNLSAVSATDCNIQSFTTISSGIAPEADLGIGEDKGVNTSTRDLVLAAISVMKGRKARPDTKRICNWVNRKYGRSVQEVVQQIDDLCQQSILEKVDYKGSISFRITSEKKLHKRVGRRKNSALSPGGSSDQIVGEPSTPKPPRASSPRKSPKGGANRSKESGPGGGGVSGAIEKMDPVTLNLILREELKLAPDDLVTKENIVNALEMTKRPINKRAVYRDLETILAHEIHLGYLVKHQEANSFLLASINKHKHYRGTIPLKSSKRKPKPTQKLLEMESGKVKTEKYSEYVTFDADGNFTQSGVAPTSTQIKEEPSVTESSSIKSDEDIKDELIKATLINNSLMKMKSKPKSGKGKHKKDPPSRGNSVQGPILSVPTPYSSMTGSCTSDHVNSFSYSPAATLQHSVNPAVSMPPFCSTGVQVTSPGMVPPATFSNISGSVPYTNMAHLPPHTEMCQPLATNQSLGSPTVEILPVHGTTQTKPRMPLDELSMTTIQHDDRKPSAIIPIKPKVKKEAWQVSITVKEAKPKSELLIPQVATSGQNVNTYTTSATNTVNDNKTTDIVKKESFERAIPERTVDPVPMPAHIKSLPNMSELPVSRKTKVSDLQPIDYSKEKKPVIDKVEENKSSPASVRKADQSKSIPAKIGRKRSMEDKQDQVKEIAPRSITSRSSRYQKVDSVEEKPTIEIEENVTMEKKATKRRISKTNDDEPEEVNNCIKKKETETKSETKKSKVDDSEQLVKRKQNVKAVNNTETASKTKRSQRNSCSPEPEEDAVEGDEQQEEQEVPQIEPRTSSGRRKRARKIFDPADHDVPSRIIKKCRTMSPIPPIIQPSSRTARSNSSDLPQTNGLKELMQPLEESLTDEEVAPSSRTPSPPPLDIVSYTRSTRRAAQQPPDISPVNSVKSSARSRKGSGPAASQPLKLNGTRRKSRDQGKNSEAETSISSTKSDKLQPSDKKAAPSNNTSSTNCDQEQQIKHSDIHNGKNKDSKKVQPNVKEESEFKVPQRPVNKSSPINNKIKKSKAKTSLNVVSKSSKNKSGKNNTNNKGSRGGGGRDQGEADVKPKDKKEIQLCCKCDIGHKKTEKLIFCKDCGNTIHPKCLNYPEELTDRIYKQAWQCIECKLCIVCVQPGNDDKLLFCDSCDQAYHMSCHRPAIVRPPRGRWECDSCAAHTGYKGDQEDKLVPAGAHSFFEELLPVLPPGVSQWPHLGNSHRFCPAVDQYPPHWEDLPVDESIPNIADWSAARMSQYLVQNGIKETVAKVFFDQEIDGASVLVLTRKDVLHSLGMKLGPALKVYQHIRRLQTRRQFGPLPY